ncbi:hypothetical protein WOLCODRAFT_151906 [Wolfiporia cocos MD-104 SS10]|uniref:Uncharacterized protein n=1 Tax=Wolfiporia cocos (strain MD-104) TaxID=742152 RepID=A0A2H3JVK5_WOLCO|nr:hypothetical protein WOLCODRAFT_151906 [Wolfiporia cocos MD-104 SS10]
MSLLATIFEQSPQRTLGLASRLRDQLRALPRLMATILPDARARGRTAPPVCLAKYKLPDPVLFAGPARPSPAMVERIRSHREERGVRSPSPRRQVQVRLGGGGSAATLCPTRLRLQDPEIFSGRSRRRVFCARLND